MLPTITIPVSRKVVVTFIVAAVVALLRTVGVYETSADLTAWITAGAGLLAGALVGEGAKYVNYFLERRGIAVHVDDRP